MFQGRGDQLFPEGGTTFSRVGGGGQMLISIATNRNCDFTGGPELLSSLWIGIHIILQYISTYVIKNVTGRSIANITGNHWWKVPNILIQRSAAENKFVQI